MEMKKMRVGVVGSGIISEIYLKNMINTFKNIEVVACCSAHMESAKKRAAQFNIEARTYDEILADPTIEMVVILTPTPTHYELIKKGLEAGKHVYTEKVMCVTKEQSAELLKLSSEKGLYLGAAPDTFLGSSLQTARKVMDEGTLGEITGFHVNATRDIDRLACMFRFIRQPAGGVAFDYGVYYMTALVSLFGPVKRVFATVRNLATTRPNVVPEDPEYGTMFEYNNESQVQAILEMESGVVGTFCINGDTIRPDLADFMVYGKDGALKLCDPNYFGGDVVLMPRNYKWGGEAQVVENTMPFSANSRGVGPSEMVWAIQNGKLNRANKYISYHVLDTLCAMVESSEKEQYVEVKSTCERPDAFDVGKDLI